MTSGAYGWTLGGACGVAMVEPDLLELDGTLDVTVTCGARAVPATLSARPFYDPDGTRLR